MMIRMLLVLIALSAAIGCSDDSSPPRQDFGNILPDQGPGNCSNCSGCCQAGQCMPGSSDNACGFGGLTCQVCDVNSQCTNGTCVPQQPQCGTSTCSDGCCNAAGLCVNPPTDTDCGKGGAPCAACDSSKTCQDGECKEPAPTTYEVKIHGCEVKHSDCGAGDDCDPFAKVSLGSGAEVETPSLSAVEQAVWDFKLFEATDKELLANKLNVTVLDDDTIWDDELGKCELTVTEAILAAGELVQDCGEKVKNLKMLFIPKAP